LRLDQTRIGGIVNANIHLIDEDGERSISHQRPMYTSRA